MGKEVEVVYPRCAGLDIHQKTVVACRITVDEHGESVHEVRTFRTMTQDLLALSTWLTHGAVTHVAMESTGVYWKPVFNLLENSFHLLLVNAQHIKAVPGRKTDVKDSEWIAQLLRLGLLRASFVPERDQREVRELTRYRTTLIQSRAAEVNRIQKTLEGANIKLGAVASDVLGMSGRAMLDAIIAGATEDDAAELAQLALGKMKAKIKDLEQALSGRVHAHQRFLLARQLALVDHLDGLIADLDTELVERLRFTEEQVVRLDGITGVGLRTAQIIVTEMGVDMTRFPTAGHLTSWAGLAPGNHVSAGKRRTVHTRRGNSPLRAVLVQAALAASKSKDTALAARFKRIAGRRGVKKAAVAVARHLLVIAYHLLKDGTVFTELGVNYLDARSQDRYRERLVSRLQQLGYSVTLALTPPPPVPMSA